MQPHFNVIGVFQGTPKRAALMLSESGSAVDGWRRIMPRAQVVTMNVERGGRKCEARVSGFVQAINGQCDVQGMTLSPELAPYTPSERAMAYAALVAKAIDVAAQALDAEGL